MATINYLVVAGGGGGGGYVGGGGGGGGVINSSTTAAVTTYPVVVGAAGTGGSNNNTATGRGGLGGNSSIDGQTAAGGGGGNPSTGATSPIAGGSGGGAGYKAAGGQTGAAGTVGQGNNGGNSPNANSGLAGGGGGASAVGGNTVLGINGGDGGAGFTSSISGSSAVYGSGGGGATQAGSGSAGGVGGANAGSGSVTAAGGAATANLGGGGGGGTFNGSPFGGGAGGSGVVIVSYTDDGVITATGGTITTSGGNKIHTFTSSGNFQITAISVVQPIVETSTATDVTDTTVTYKVNIVEATFTTQDTVSASQRVSDGETANAVDAVTVKTIFSVSVTESAPATDTVNAVNGGTQTIIETATATDTTNTTATYHVTDPEVAAALDTVSVSVVYHASVVESGSASDTTNYNTSSIIAEVTTASDTVSATIVYTASVSESANAQDSQRTPTTHVGIIIETGLPIDRQSTQVTPPIPPPTPGGGPAANKSVKALGPLDWRIPIVTKEGRPTSEFQRRWEIQTANNVQIGAITIGSGTPPILPAPEDGAQYADTSTNPYTMYIANGGTWYVTGGASANPTAVAGDVAINGSANTFMRSDGAPAVQKGLSSQFGIVKVDGSTITSVGGVISASGGGGGGVTTLGYQTFSYTTPPSANFSLSALAYVVENITISKLAFVVRTATPGTVYQPAVYSDAGGTPGTLLGSGSVITGVTAGLNEPSLSAPLVLTKGSIVWLTLTITGTGLPDIWCNANTLGAFVSNGGVTTPPGTASGYSVGNSSGYSYAIWGVV